MSQWIRHGKLDVVIAAGPRTPVWPTPGARILTATCNEFGLSSGLVGGEELLPRGVVVLQGTGGLLLAEDQQERLHRFQARSIVKIQRRHFLPRPFKGSSQAGLIPLDTARALWSRRLIRFSPGTVIIGTSNAAFSFAIELLEAGIKDVFCLETKGFRNENAWGLKNFSGWEVLKRRFEILGGKLIYGKPVELQKKAPLLWNLLVEDEHGIRLFEVAYVVGAGPYDTEVGLREYPSGSLLFELEQTASGNRDDDIEGWTLEEDRARSLATHIVRTLVSEMSEKRNQLDWMGRRAKKRIKEVFAHREEPFVMKFEGKWVEPRARRELQGFSGVAQGVNAGRTVASLECIEPITCNLCEKACPEKAIEISPHRDEFRLHVEDCTGCGRCVQACPAGVAVMIRSSPQSPNGVITLKWSEQNPVEMGGFVWGLNREGAQLGQVRVVGRGPQEQGQSWIQVEAPSHLLSELRGIKKIELVVHEAEFNLMAPGYSRVEVTLDSVKRLARERITVQDALFEMGMARAEDVLRCGDGSCGLCDVEIDGLKRRACQTKVRRGMTIKTKIETPWSPHFAASGVEKICECQNVSWSALEDELKRPTASTAESLCETLGIGSGRCHGQRCGEQMILAAREQSLEWAENWIDWRFPWMDWTLTLGSQKG
jgi:ferredoxin